MTEKINVDINKACFKNKICQDCIKSNIKKYGTFDISCDGITVEEDVKLAIKEGLDEHEARMMFDTVYYFEEIYGSKVRWYQSRILYCTSRNLVGRQCRQTGKTLMFMYKIFHFIHSNPDVTVLVVTPMEAQIKKIWDEYIFRDWYHKSELIKESIGRNYAQAPYYNVRLDNGSKIILMIAGPGARSQSSDILYMDEAAIIPKEELNSIMGTILSRGDAATVYMTSTPKGRGNAFYDACKLDPQFNEYHVSINEVEEIKSQIPRFKKILGETGFIQECEAEFPDTSGGPFNFKGIDLAKKEYDYEDCHREPGWIYMGGVDWNGPNVGTYLSVIGFNPDTYHIKVVAKEVVASATWNSTVAKQKFIELNRKWQCKHWMVDSGFGHTITEELRYWSTYNLPDNVYADKHADMMIKHILEPVEFGSWIKLEDPFTKEEIKKTAKSYIVSQVSRLFEPENDYVPFSFSINDQDLIESLENYKLLQITDSGVEKYGFDKKGGIEDHLLDSVMLAVYAVVKYYQDLFKTMIMLSEPIDAREIFTPKKDNQMEAKVGKGKSVVLITDNSPELIELDDAKLRPEADQNLAIISRTFDRYGNRNSQSLNSMMSRRNSHIINRRLDI